MKINFFENWFWYIANTITSNATKVLFVDILKHRGFDTGLGQKKYLAKMSNDDLDQILSKYFPTQKMTFGQIKIKRSN
jgi:hypothetical protein